jgi:hypothetical protein
MSQTSLNFPERESDADDSATKKPKGKRKRQGVVEPLPGVWDNCRKGDHQLCAIQVFSNTNLSHEHCECICHKW